MQYSSGIDFLIATKTLVMISMSTNQNTAYLARIGTFFQITVSIHLGRARRIPCHRQYFYVNLNSECWQITKFGFWMYITFGTLRFW